MSMWRTWSRMSASERGLLVGAWVRVVAVRTALWVLPSSWIIRYVKQLSAPTAPRSGPSRPVPARVTPGEIVWAVDVASRRMRDATCVTQAVSALLLLRRHGYEARFCVGVAKSKAGAVSAHAWLEREGRVLIGRTEQQFVRMTGMAGTK